MIAQAGSDDRRTWRDRQIRREVCDAVVRVVQLPCETAGGFRGENGRQFLGTGGAGPGQDEAGENRASKADDRVRSRKHGVSQNLWVTWAL